MLFRSADCDKPNEDRATAQGLGSRRGDILPVPSHPIGPCRVKQHFVCWPSFSLARPVRSCPDETGQNIRYRAVMSCRVPGAEPHGRVTVR